MIRVALRRQTTSATRSKQAGSRASSYRVGCASALQRATWCNSSAMLHTRPLFAVGSVSARRGFASYPDHEVLRFPSLSPTMEMGNLPEWGKKVGEQILPGDTIAVIETDKATLPWDSTEEGFIAKHLVEAGATDIKVGTPVAIVCERLEDVAAFANYEASGSATPAAAPAAAAATAAVATSAAPPAQPSMAPAPSAGTVLASPYARSVARQRGIDLSALPGGSGQGGLVTAKDVMSAQPGAPKAAPALATPAAAAATMPAPGGASGEYTDVAHSNIRKVIASRLSQSKQTVPHYYLSVDVCMDKVLAVRAKLNKQIEKADKPKISVNDFVIKACAKALTEVRAVNASWMDNAVRQYNYVDISVAVSTPSGLVTPIVRDADLKGLTSISRDVQDLAKRARENKLMPTDYQGGTFTISNLGMFGIKNFSAIINPPQAAILAVGGSEARIVVNPAAKEGEDKYMSSQFMSVTMSADHRVIDGAIGAAWLKAFKSNLEDPLNMLL
eukprot:gb/GEZN01006394.1/.p1 GENE.gb/GEZN01006394.1/~~gb/GEZN01006394.1/.p1  ORF type:complete len:512 (-),score=81.63 gb/GEZN01006394.1/:135-1640(-)